MATEIEAQLRTALAEALELLDGQIMPRYYELITLTGLGNNTDYTRTSDARRLLDRCRAMGLLDGPVSRRLTLMVTASRHLDSYEFVAHHLRVFDPYRPQLWHGGAKGGDTHADEYAREHGWPDPIVRRVTDEEWRRIGPGAGPRRNREMHDEAKPDVLVAFRAPGKSNGTDGMIAYARSRFTPVWELRLEDWTPPPVEQYTFF